MALVDVYTAKRENSVLRNRTAAQIAASAWEILALTPADTADRLAWAKATIPTVDSVADAWMWAVCGNATVQAAGFNPTDNDIAFIVGVLINNYAGAAV